MTQQTDLNVIRCTNCGHCFSGHFCSFCGQRKASSKELKYLVKEVVKHFIEFDKRILSTVLQLIVRPGTVEKMFIEGRRQTFTHPVRLYLIISLVFSIVIKVETVGYFQNFVDTSQSEASLTSEDVISSLDSNLEKKGLWDSVFDRYRNDITSLFEHAASLLPFGLILFIPILSFTRMIIFRYQKIYFIDHLLITFYEIAGLFLLFILYYTINYALGSWISYLVFILHIFTLIHLRNRVFNGVRLLFFIISNVIYFVILGLFLPATYIASIILAAFLDYFGVFII